MNEPSQSIEAILREVERRYAALPWYADEGEMWSYDDTDGKPSRWARFRTRYERGGRFLFVYEPFDDGEPDGVYVVSSEDGKTFRTRSFGDEETLDFEMAIGSLTGVTHGVAALVIGLLHEGIVYPATRMREAVRAGDGVALDRPCLRIRGRNRIDDEQTLWIDRGSGLLVRLEEEGVVDAVSQDALDPGVLDLMDPEMRQEIEEALSGVEHRAFWSRTVIDVRPVAGVPIPDSEFRPPEPPPKQSWFEQARHEQR